MDVRILVAGSAYRKMRCFKNDDNIRVGDVDVVMAAKNLGYAKSVIEMLFGTCKNGNPCMKGIIGKTQVDIFPVPLDQLGAALLFYRAPQPLQISLRILSRARGYKFSPHGLFKIQRNFDTWGGIEEKISKEAEETPSTCDVWGRWGLKAMDWYEMEAAAHYEMKEQPRIAL